MIQSIISFSLRQKLLVGLFVLGLLLWGGWSLSRLPIDAVPDITNNQVQVITQSPALSAIDMERLVTFPLEMSLKTIPGIRELRSFSRFGLSIITVVFDDDVDVYWARQQVTERMRTAESEIPRGSGTPELAPVTTGLGEIYQYILRPLPGYESVYNTQELRTLQDWVVRRGLLGTEGIADVSSFGGYLKQVEVALFPERLRQYGVSVAEVFDALKRNNENTGGAYIEHGPNSYSIRTEGLTTNLEEVGALVVRPMGNSTVLRIRDLAEVRYGSAIRYGAMTRNDEGEVVGAVVMMLKGANSSSVIEAVKKRMAVVQRLLPPGVRIEPYLDRTKLVDQAIHTVAKNLAEGALIVVLVLVFMLGNLRAGLVVASVIPLSLCFAFGLMHLWGVSGNLMSLGALDFGLIVDGAVIIVESVVHGLHLHLQRKGTLTRPEFSGLVGEQSGRMMRAAAFGQAIILVVYLPILSLVGIEGKMFKPMAQTVVFALVGAFILSLTYVPVASALFLSLKKPKRVSFSERILNRIQRIYGKTLEVVLARPKTVLASALLALALSAALFSRLGGEFIPTLEEGDFAVETRVPKGSSLEVTRQAATQAAHILQTRFPEVVRVVGKIGTSEIPTDPMPMEACDLIVVLKDRSEWTSAHSREELAALMEKALQEVPGATFGFQQPIQMRFNELMTGARQDVVVKLYGEDLDTLAHYAQRLGSLSRTVEGARDVFVEQVTGLDQVVIRHKPEALLRYGLSVASVNEAVNLSFAGQATGKIYEGERRFDLVVRLAGPSRTSLEDVRRMPVVLPGGQSIPLEALADVRLENGPNQIQRDDARRRIIVGFNVRGRDVERVVADLRQAVEKGLRLPTGYEITYGGAFQNLVEAKARLSVALPLALLLILIMLYFSFQSVRIGLLIFSAIPLSAMGGVLALWLRGMPFSTSAGIGFIALFGVAVLNGIVLLVAFEDLRKEGMEDATERVRNGTAQRLRPVLMTALVASLGFLPMALSTSAGAEVQKPLATVVMGGLVSATLLTLLVLPLLYVRFGTPRRGVAAALLLFLLVHANHLSAQPIRSEMELVQQALRAHPAMQAAEAEQQAAKSLESTWWSLPPTEAGYQQGQISSKASDNLFSLSQDLPSLSALVATRRALQAQTRLSEAEAAEQKRVLVQALRMRWQHLLLARALLVQQRQADSLMTWVEERAQRRYASGEGTRLEWETARLRASTARQQVATTSREVDRNRAVLAILSGVEATALEPPDTLMALPSDSLQKPEQQPAWLRWSALEALHDAELKQEQARMRPRLSLGYFNQSLIGYQGEGADRFFFTRQNRFDGFSARIMLPLGAWLQPGRVQSAKLRSQAAKARSQSWKRNSQAAFEQLRQRVAAAQELMQFAQTQRVPSARLVMTLALNAYRAGEVPHTETALAIDQYLQALQSLNQATFDYNLSLIEWQTYAVQP
jgi:cobalt-zinc-cadmium resistance protein CzcA